MGFPERVSDLCCLQTLQYLCADFVSAPGTLLYQRYFPSMPPRIRSPCTRRPQETAAISCRLFPGLLPPHQPQA